MVSLRSRPLSSRSIVRIRRAGLLASSLALALTLTGCLGAGDLVGSLGGSSTASLSRPLPTDDGELRRYADDWGKKFEAKPQDKVAALNYARALRALARYNEAVAVLQRAVVSNPRDTTILGTYGKALADVGSYQQAAQVLAKANSPERPDWSLLSAQGTVADQLGDYGQAQGYYTAALKIVPGEPTVLSNLGLSYALQKRLPDAETTLRQAAADPRADMRVRQNYALVLALQGKFAEAEQVSRRDLTPGDAAANVQAIREMIAQSNTWREIRKLDSKSASAQTEKPAVRSAQIDDPAN